MKVQVTGSQPRSAATLSTDVVARALASWPQPNSSADIMAAIARMPKVWPLPAAPAPAAASSLPRPPTVHVFSPAVAAGSPSKDKVMNSLRSLSDLITPHCGQPVSIAASAIWLAVDGVSAEHTFRDPTSTLSERVAAGGAVGSDLFALCGGIFGAPGLNQAANALNFVAVVGDHVHTGKITFTPGELVEFSNQPDSDDVSNLLKLTEVLAPGTAS